MIRLDILPSAQRAFWEEDSRSIPPGWVLYGGTAVALHLGHRQSTDFDFFSSDPLDRKALHRGCPALTAAKTLQNEPDTLTVVLEKAGEPIKLSFFGGIDFGRVGDPIRSSQRPPLASRLDLFGTKLATITQRIEARDYVDVAALIGSGLNINEGVGALLGLYGNQASALQSVKTLTWFNDGGLATALSAEVRQQLERAAAVYDPHTRALPKRSHRLD